jgi:hypothetical protein
MLIGANHGRSKLTIWHLIPANFWGRLEGSMHIKASEVKRADKGKREVMDQFPEVQNFKTYGDAKEYCKKYGIIINGNPDVLNIANALARAFLDGCRHQAEIEEMRKKEE